MEENLCRIFFKEAGHSELAKTGCKHLQSNKLNCKGRLDAADLDHHHEFS